MKMNFWQVHSQTPMSAQTGYAMSTKPLPEEQFTRKLPQIYDQPGYGEAFAALAQANQQVRLHRGKKKTLPTIQKNG